MIQGMTLRREGKVLRVDMVSQCGRQFFNVATVYEPESDNPLIGMPKPLGANALRVLLTLLDVEREGRKRG